MRDVKHLTTERRTTHERCSIWSADGKFIVTRRISQKHGLERVLVDVVSAQSTLLTQ